MVNAKAHEQVTQHITNEKILRVLKWLSLEYERKERENPFRILSDRSVGCPRRVVRARLTRAGRGMTQFSESDRGCFAVFLNAGAIVWLRPARV